MGRGSPKMEPEPAAAAPRGLPARRGAWRWGAGSAVGATPPSRAVVAACVYCADTPPPLPPPTPSPRRWRRQRQPRGLAGPTPAPSPLRAAAGAWQGPPVLGARSPGWCRRGVGLWAGVPLCGEAGAPPPPPRRRPAPRAGAEGKRGWGGGLPAAKAGCFSSSSGV